MKIGIFILLLMISQSQSLAQFKPVIGLHKNVPNVVFFKNARIIPMPGKVLEHGSLLVRDGRIEALGQNLSPPTDAMVLDINGKTIYPGFIDLFSTFGLDKKDILREIKETNGSDETSGAHYWNPEVHPQIQAANLLKANEDQADVLRGVGFTTVLTFPEDGIFRGSGALVQLLKDSPNNMILESKVAQSMSFKKGSASSAKGAYAYPRSAMGSVSLIHQVLLDTQWYRQAWNRYKHFPSGQKPPLTDMALEALVPFLDGKKAVIMATSNELEIFRSSKIAQTFNLNMWIMGSGSEYRRINEIKKQPLKLIIPLNFPEAPDVSSEDQSLTNNLRTLKHWDAAPENAGRLARENINFALSAFQLKKQSNFIKNLRLAVKRGLPEDAALKALTITPAKWLQLSNQLGSLEKGKLANLFITDGDLFKDNTQILETWVNGRKHSVIPLPDEDPRGQWKVTITTNDVQDTLNLNIDGTLKSLEATLSFCMVKEKIKKIKFESGILTFSFSGDSSCYAGITRLTGIITNHHLSGIGKWGDGRSLNWQADRIKPWKKHTEKKVPESAEMAKFPVVYPDGAFGFSSIPAQPATLAIKNATIWTSGSKGIIENGDLLIENGKIVRIGRDLQFPADAKEIDGTGKHLTAGLIDAHAHIAGSGGLNEGSQAITPEVRVRDVINSDDINIYRQLAGGVTTVCTLHGSANPIGGTYAVIKLRWGEMPDKMIIKDARDGIKFALGENVKQSGWKNPVPRYPQTRMGVMEIIEDTFRAALDYRQKWADYEKKSKKKNNLIPPRKNLRYEKILDILDGKTIIHCHSYRQDETLALMRLAEELGFKIDVFIHMLEGYKIASELKAHGAMATTFSDWWTYKMEAYDAIPYNGAIMHEQGIIVSYDSDSAELARRLNTEAAKAVKYGNVQPEEAIKFVTLNAAKQLYLDDQIGSLEVGKDADFVIWSESPLSTYSKCEQTWIDGRKYFDIEEDQRLREMVAKERNALIQKILSQGENKESKNSH